ncbi:MAG: hypothetical protein KF886_23010 [Candidatus Hydrogenedentes bacterium]|nr:hypothetical protein [Candidatus Hydrogenedentota bacterium]
MQNEATVQKIESSPIFAEYTWRTTMTLGPAPGPDGADLSGRMIAEGRARYWRHGASFCEDRNLKNTWPDKGEVQDGSNIFLINDRYAVDFRKQLNVLHLYHFDDRNNLYPAVRTQVELYPNPKILEFGALYSTGRTLKEAYEQQVGGGQSGYRWTPIESNVGGNLHYRIVSERTAGEHNRLHQETSIDPHSGFLLSETRTYNKNGEPFHIVQARFQQVGNAMWFPRSVSRNISQGQHIMDIEVEKVTLGDPEIQKMITLEALDIDRESVLMVEYSSRGMQRTKKGYLDGNWVHFDLLPPERRDAINTARRNAGGG